MGTCCVIHIPLGHHCTTCHQPGGRHHRRAQCNLRRPRPRPPAPLCLIVRRLCTARRQVHTATRHARHTSLAVASTLPRAVGSERHHRAVSASPAAFDRVQHGALSVACQDVAGCPSRHAWRVVLAGAKRGRLLVVLADGGGDVQGARCSGGTSPTKCRGMSRPFFVALFIIITIALLLLFTLSCHCILICCALQCCFAVYNFIAVTYIVSKWRYNRRAPKNFWYDGTTTW